MGNGQQPTPAPVVFTPPKPAKSSTAPWVLLGIAIGGAMLIGGFALLMLWGFSLFAAQAQEAMNQNPVILAHVGQVETAHFDFSATVINQATDVFVFDVVGSKGSGQVVAKFTTVSGHTERVTSGVLKMTGDGEYPLVPQH